MSACMVCLYLVRIYLRKMLSIICVTAMLVIFQMFSDLPADHIIQTHQMRDVTSSSLPLLTTSAILQPTSFTAPTSTQRARNNAFDSLSAVSNRTQDLSALVNEPFVYSPLRIEFNGPSPPSVEDLTRLK